MIGANNFMWSLRGLTPIVTDDFDLQQFFQYKLPLADLITFICFVCASPPSNDSPIDQGA